MLALLAARTGATTPAAQGPQAVPFTFHIYVDPMFGDDGEAAAENPGGTRLGIPPPFGTHPDAPFNMASVPAGNVRHAPYSFRTLTGAINYATALEEMVSSADVPWMHT